MSSKKITSAASTITKPPRIIHTARQRNTSILKWHFTWIIAVLPVIFHIGKQFLINGETDLAELCGKGDLFLVSIVMVSEPLSKIFGTNDKRPAHYVFLILSVAVVLMCTYAYAVTDISPEYRAICSKKETFEQKEKNSDTVCNMSDKSHIFAPNSQTDTETHQSDVFSQEEHENCSVKQENEEDGISKEDEERLLRLLYLSIGTIIASYCIGLNTLVYAHK